IARVTWQRNTLDRKQYASRGTLLRLSVKGVTGEETTIPGSTSFLKDTTFTEHRWLVLKANYTNYFFQRQWVGMGFHLSATYSTQDFFENYVSSSIMAPAFEPLPESPSLFLPQFRSHAYATGGMELIVHLARNVELRGQAHLFGTQMPLISNSRNQPVMGDSPQVLFTGSGTLVLHSPLGPVSLSANYYDNKDEPWSILFNFGYLLYNASSRE
ncbi:MAG: hypothetical protein JNM00_10205, partial [Flavobacteriales bacterium]|nr:hypothetical protein [Flavobacteriales bacterium]